MKTKTICLYWKGRVRWIAPGDILINRNTPRGEPAALYERKPYGGKRPLQPGELLGEIDKDGRFEVEDCGMTKARWAVIESLGIEISGRLFHNGEVYTTKTRPFQTLKQALHGG